MKLFWVTLCLAVLPQWALAQVDGDAGEEGSDTQDVAYAAMSPQEAQLILAQALPDDPPARYALLQRQYSAARGIEDRARLIEAARQLMVFARGRPDAEHWILDYLNAEFTWGSSGKALESSEPYVVDAGLSLGTRAAVALRQTYFAAQGNDRTLLARLWARADTLSSQAIAQGQAPARMPVDRLQVRAEIERFRGDSAAAVASLREAIGLARRELQMARTRSTGPQDSAVLEAYGRLDGSMGMLNYALVRQGRAQEAIDLAQSNIALWRAGQISDGLGARWNYRLATGLVSTQQYAAGLLAARTADDMLQRAGASAASHTRWLARQEVVRALIGLKRWTEADAAYREFLAAMPADALARTRASDWRLLALLAAKNGRFNEALELAERSHRYRLRLYGANHPQTQEAAGVRAVVRLLQGETRLAMQDYEALFAATLDNPAGWIDLEQRGVRGYVLGIAFDEFMRWVAERVLKGQPVDATQSDRALQIADRNSLGVTQRALVDSSARLTAQSPALRALLEEEQRQRQAVSALLSKVNESLGTEDRLRRDSQTETFKTLPEAERKPLLDQLKAVREQIKTQQAAVNTARATLNTQRESIATQFPAYADLVTPTMPKAAQLRGLLGAGEALLVLQPTDGATLVWLITPGTETRFSVLPLDRSALEQRVAQVRSLLDLGTLQGGAAAPLAQLHALYRDLLQGLEPQLREVRSLIVATEGPLASVPFATLLTAPPTAGTPPAWLVQRMAVTQMPSASSLLALRRAPAPAPAAKALLGFGDPLFRLAATAPAGPARTAKALSQAAGQYDAEWGFRYADVPPLPETRTELLALAQALGADAQTDLLLGAQATRRAVLKAHLLDRRVVAFATHGLMPGELPGISRPALAMAANVDANESPLLELDDVLTLRLNAQWVVLSACNTAAGERGKGAMSGLVRGFFFAGGRSVLATHWAVESESAAALSAATFAPSTQGPRARAESLRQAQLAMLDGRLGGGRWQHPYYWAPYALFGDPAR